MLNHTVQRILQIEEVELKLKEFFKINAPIINNVFSGLLSLKWGFDGEATGQSDFIQKYSELNKNDILEKNLFSSTMVYLWVCTKLN